MGFSAFASEFPPRNAAAAEAWFRKVRRLEGVDFCDIVDLLRFRNARERTGASLLSNGPGRVVFEGCEKSEMAADKHGSTPISRLF
jgi:hypothetical protein